MTEQCLGINITTVHILTALVQTAICACRYPDCDCETTRVADTAAWH